MVLQPSMGGAFYMFDKDGGGL